MLERDATRVEIWNRCAETFRGWVYPTECQICEGADGPVCEECRADLLDQNLLFCGRCARAAGPYENLENGCAACRDRRLGFDAATALGPYQGPIRRLCLMLKQRRNAWLARSLADLLIDARRDFLSGQPVDLVAAVPLHWRRRWSRGYDQSLELAKAIGRRLDLKVARLLARVEDTAPLAGLGRVERFKRLRSAFQVRGRANLRGKSVLLVDDILTTGATCGAAARELKKAGARRVAVAVIGRADGGRRAGL
jgi:ComF family protein